MYLFHFLRVGNNALLFFPGNLERMITRAIPFMLAGLAVALGFKAGLFNIGAEGQLYAGAIVAAWIGTSITDGSSQLIIVPAILIIGFLGGFLWGAIPGALKAFTGAHEVITTIMLNFIAILTVDWLIKSREPLLLGDPDSNLPQTAFVQAPAELPVFDALSTPALILLLIFSAIVVFAVTFFSARNPETAVRLRRSILWSIGTVILLIFMRGITVRGQLHLGLLLALAAIWLVEWFLRTQ